MDRWLVVQIRFIFIREWGEIRVKWWLQSGMKQQKKIFALLNSVRNGIIIVEPDLLGVQLCRLQGLIVIDDTE